MTILQTTRLLLRPIAECDFEAHARITADPDVMQYIHAGPLTRDQAWWNIARYVGHWQMRGYGMWAVVERTTADVIGHIGFLNPEGGRGLELGWALAREAWGKGYALEGTRAALAYAFGELGAHTVTCVIRAENAASVAVAERLGADVVQETHETGKRLIIYHIVRDASGVV